MRHILTPRSLRGRHMLHQHCNARGCYMGRIRWRQQMAGVKAKYLATAMGTGKALATEPCQEEWTFAAMVWGLVVGT